MLATLPSFQLEYLNGSPDLNSILNLLLFPSYFLQRFSFIFSMLLNIAGADDSWQCLHNSDEAVAVAHAQLCLLRRMGARRYARCTCDRRRLSSSVPSSVSWTWKLSAKNGKLSRVCGSHCPPPPLLHCPVPTCPLPTRCPATASVAHTISLVGSRVVKFTYAR